MTLFPHCKINLGLRVLRKREDGYHDLETVFYPVFGLHDTLEVNPLDLPNGQTIVSSLDEDNLVVRCYRLMASRFPSIGSVEVRLTKVIPMGAGLGGGSSDAAHMAIALNELFHLNLTRQQLAAEVQPLGADCPFFAYDVPCFAQGIGDKLTPLDWSLRGKHLLMIKPPVFVSTKEAYAGVTPCPVSIADRLQRGEYDTTANDFEPSVFAQHPLLPRIKRHLLDIGACYAAMSGSGSTVFGLFEQDAKSGPDAYLARLDKDFAPMVIFNDTLG
ncbi:MAG: 4-(cytidine 5'-diphospho)-2-C-methyl-D-erythritol kinase [Paludibacteraceae bacterium]|nr:4-(cytidine 5'-diphospho)-2-C-methyl-D-erythritol kinase [Paludibacteraceae bacterium]